MQGFPHFTIMKTGETHMLRYLSENRYEFSGTRNNWDTVGGIMELERSGKDNLICFTFQGQSRFCALKSDVPTRELTMNLSDSLQISGELYTPDHPNSNYLAVLLHGDGENDRFDVYDAGMYLVNAGYSVFAFDKRNAGKSSGPSVRGDNYDAISREYASDAVKVVNELQNRYPDKNIGVLGISQGGWIGSIVSARVTDLAFYINIAGSVSIGWQQWRHYMISYLKRNEFSKDDVAEAQDYFRWFFDMGLGRTDFDKYQTTYQQFKDKPWFKNLERRKLIAWKDKDQALEVLKRNLNDPARDLRKVRSPSLGIFYQYDHSTPEDTPKIFLENVRASRSSDVCVRIFPNTTHGGWMVPGYYFSTSEITHQNAKAYYFIINWLESLGQ